MEQAVLVSELMEQKIKLQLPTVPESQLMEITAMAFLLPMVKIIM